jgi:hypothetical protein
MSVVRQRCWCLSSSTSSVCCRGQYFSHIGRHPSTPLLRLPERHSERRSHARGALASIPSSSVCFNLRFPSLSMSWLRKEKPSTRALECEPYAAKRYSNCGEAKASANVTNFVSQPLEICTSTSDMSHNLLIVAFSW